MPKDHFLWELRKRLSILNEQEVEKIIKEYDAYFIAKMEEGLSENEVLDQLGDVNLIAKGVLEAYHLNDRYIKWFVGKERFIDEINGYAGKIADTSIDVLDRIESGVKTVVKKTVAFGEESFKTVKNSFKRSKEESTSEESTFEDCQNETE